MDLKERRCTNNSICITFTPVANINLFSPLPSLGLIRWKRVTHVHCYHWRQRRRGDPMAPACNEEE